jgi:hypothetical protein
MKTLVVRKVINGSSLKLRLVRVGPGVISQGVMKLEQVRVICPACGQQIEAVARDGQVKGYCAVAKQFVDFPIETQLERKNFYEDPEFRSRHSTAAKKLWQDPEYRAKQIATHTGKHPTAKTKAKISAALKRRHTETIIT